MRVYTWWWRWYSQALRPSATRLNLATFWCIKVAQFRPSQCTIAGLLDFCSLFISSDLSSRRKWRCQNWVFRRSQVGGVRGTFHFNSSCSHCCLLICFHVVWPCYWTCKQVQNSEFQTSSGRRAERRDDKYSSFLRIAWPLTRNISPIQHYSDKVPFRYSWC